MKFNMFGRPNNPARRQNEHARDSKKANLQPLEVKFNKGGRIMSDAIEINAMNLYILFNYEKGRLCTSRLIIIWEKKRLKTSIEMMAKILCALKYRNCPTDKINAFIDNNRGRIFPINCSSCEKILDTNYSEKQSEILNLMSYILCDMGSVLSRFWVKKSQLKELYCLLHAFHNLPRAFFDSSSKLYMEPTDVLQYANEWLSKMSN